MIDYDITFNVCQFITHKLNKTIEQLFIIIPYRQKKMLFGVLKKKDGRRKKKGKSLN